MTSPLELEEEDELELDDVLLELELEELEELEDDDVLLELELEELELEELELEELELEELELNDVLDEDDKATQKEREQPRPELHVPLP
jgi:hypothetical protein